MENYLALCRAHYVAALRVALQVLWQGSSRPSLVALDKYSNKEQVSPIQKLSMRIVLADYRACAWFRTYGSHKNRSGLFRGIRF
jgi:hypothetical protein